jgi:hypothetical protein
MHLLQSEHFWPVERLMIKACNGRYILVRLREFLLKLLFAYLAVGTVYALTGYAARAIARKPETFSPIVGIPLAVLGWPSSLRATLMHFGWTPDVLLTCIALLIALVMLAAKVLRAQIKARRP